MQPLLMLSACREHCQPRDGEMGDVKQSSGPIKEGMLGPTQGRVPEVFRTILALDRPRDLSSLPSVCALGLTDPHR